MGDVLEHLSNPGLALDSIAPFLHHGGELVITCPNAYGGPNWLRFLVGRYCESPTHVTAHSKLTLANLLDRHGYRPIALYTNGAGSLIPISHPEPRLMHSSLRRLDVARVGLGHILLHRDVLTIPDHELDPIVVREDVVKSSSSYALRRDVTLRD